MLDLDSTPVLQPYFESVAPNAPIALATGPVTLRQGAHSEVLPAGSLFFHWLPHPAVGAAFTSRRLRLGPLQVSSDPENLEAEFEVFESGSGGRFWSTGDVVVRRTSSRSPSMKSADIHVPNLPLVLGAPVTGGRHTIFGRQVARFNGWVLTMDPILSAKDHEKAAKSAVGNHLTHVVQVKRADGATFRKTQLSRLVDDLYLALSFIFGDYLGPTLTAGRDDKGCVVLELLRPDPGFGWRSRFGVAPKRSGIGDMLSCLADVLGENTAIKQTIWWYLEACWSLQEASVVLGQAALERISYYYLVTSGDLLTEQAFERLTAADHIRLTMRALRVPLDLLGKGTDVPLLVTRSRNQQVHPKMKGDLVNLDRARDAALYAIELLLLRLAEYRGVYHPRTANHAGAEVLVPWKEGARELARTSSN